MLKASQHLSLARSSKSVGLSPLVSRLPLLRSALIPSRHPLPELTKQPVCPCLRWSFQSRHHYLFRYLARFPMEKSASLHLLSGLWGFHGWFASNGNVLARDQCIENGGRRKGGNCRLQWWCRQHSLRFPQPQPNESGIPFLARILRRLIHRYRYLGYVSNSLCYAFCPSLWQLTTIFSPQHVLIPPTHS